MTDPNLAYEPLEGAVLRENPDGGEFDWDSLNDDEELELWLTRVPGNVRHLRTFLCPSQSDRFLDLEEDQICGERYYRNTTGLFQREYRRIMEITFVQHLERRQR